MERLKRMLMVMLIGLGAIFIMSAPVNAVVKPQLQMDIERTINEALNEYLSTVDVKQAVNEVIDKTLATFIDDMTKETFEEAVKEQASNALMQHLSDVEKTEFSEASVGLQNTLETALRDTTYTLTNNQVKEYVKSYVMGNMDAKIDRYNYVIEHSTRYKHWVSTYSYGDDTDSGYWENNKVYVNGKRVDEYTLHIIDSRARSLMKTEVSNKLESILNVGYEVSNNVLYDADIVQFSQIATDYIKSNIIKYTNAEELLGKVRNEVKITVEDELRERIVESIQSYIESNSGQAIFTGIKDAIYYYIQQNGGLNKILEDGFSEETASYISGQIGSIVKESIQYSLAPYIKELSQGTIKEVTEDITEKYVNSGAWDVIKQAVSHNLNQMLATSSNNDGLGGDKIRNNLVNFMDSFLARSTRIIDIINEAFGSTPDKYTGIEDYVSDYWIEENHGDTTYKYKNPKYDGCSNIGQCILKQTRETTRNYMSTTVFSAVVNKAKADVNAYMNDAGGAVIKDQFISNVNHVFISDVVTPLLEEINRAISLWISNGIGTKITGELQVTITNYLASIKDADEFTNATGIKLGEIIKEVRYGGSSSSGRQIALEDLIASRSLFGVERGRIVVPRENDADAMNDATLEIGPYLPYKVQAYDSSTVMAVNPYFTGLTAIMRFFPNPYGATIGQAQIGVGIGMAGLSRTLARYDTVGIKNLSPAEAYVLAHEKHTGYYPDRTQNAYYEVLKQLRGMTTKNDEGIISKDTYSMITRAFGFASVLTNTNWKEIYANIQKADTIRQLIEAVPSNLVSSFLSATGITLKDIFPFLDGDILAVASMCGINIGSLAEMLQTSVAHVVGWVETGGTSFFEDVNYLKNAAYSAVGKVTERGKIIINTLATLPEKITDTFTPLDERIDEMEIELALKKLEVESLNSNMNEIDQRMKNASGTELDSLLAQKLELAEKVNAANSDLTSLNQRAIDLAAEYRTSIGALSEDTNDALKKALGDKYNSAEGQAILDRFSRLEVVTLPQTGGSSLKDLLWELGMNPSTGQIPTEELEKIDTLKIQELANVTSASLSAVGTVEESLDVLDRLRANMSSFGPESILSDDAFSALATDSATLNQFMNISESLGVSLTGKSMPTVFTEVLKKWEQEPDFDADAVLPFLKDVANEVDVKMGKVNIEELLDKAGMSKKEFYQKMKDASNNSNSFTSLLDNRSFIGSSLLSSLKSFMPTENEVTIDHQMEEPMAAGELADEALNLEKAVNHWNKFEAEHEGNNLVDTTNYNDVKVSYSKLTDYILVGPFTIDYVREFYYPISPTDSELVDWETGIISFTGIVGAELYADDEKTIKVEDWEFVYPDKRLEVPLEDWAYEYPYPGEVFYLRFPSMENYSINTLSRMTFRLAKMDADGQTYELHGTYDQMMWQTTGVPIPCPLVGRCICGMYGGHPLGPYMWCPPIFCLIHGAEESQLSNTMKRVNDVVKKSISAASMIGGAASSALSAFGSRNAAATTAQVTGLSTMLATQATTAIMDAMKRPPALPGTHMLGNFYFCFAIPVGVGLHAQNLEEVIYSKIYVEYQTVEMEFGNAYHRDPVYQVYHNNDVNTTNILFPAQHQGNLSIETNDVPALPFLNNYTGYPGWPNYPYYPDNPNYPDNPYYPDNTEYKDYPSWPYYIGDPSYPYYPNNPVIPLTFHIEGDVWLDNPGGTEAEVDGIYDEGYERGIPNVEVILYKLEDPDNYIAKTLTDENGHYMFEYIRVGFDYYVEFLYDGMTYRTTKYLVNNVNPYSDREFEEYKGEFIKDKNLDYIEVPENYLASSHAIEDVYERDDFNAKFEAISQNLATGEDGTTIPLEYQTWYTDNGAVSTLITTDTRGITLEEFKMPARTLTTDLIFPLDDQYQVDYLDLDLFNDGTDYYIHTYPGLEHVNLGLIKREQGDFAIKTDLYQIITTIKEDVQRYKYNDKLVGESDFDILKRTLEAEYYTKLDSVRQMPELNPDDHAYRIDTSYEDYADIVSGILTESDELNVYMEYKILIKNNGTLQSGRILVLENSFTQDLFYDIAYDYTDLTSWIEIPRDGSEEVDREEIIWHYRGEMENGYNTIFTTGLEEKNIAPGEIVEVHLVLKVNKDLHRGVILDGDDINEDNLGNGTDNGRDLKADVTEIHTYSYDEGLISKASNPGSIELGVSKTYSDSSDPAPLIKLILDRNYKTGNEITGFVWEDYIEGMLYNNNQLIGNGRRENREPLIDNVKVELIEVVTDKQTGREIEVLRKTASGTDYYRTGQNVVVDGKTLEVKPGQYRFTKLETGIFKVKFTYGDDYQLVRDLTYNAQDYKTLALDTIIQQYENPKLEVFILSDTSAGMHITDIEDPSKSGNELLTRGQKMRKAALDLVDGIYENVQTARVGAISFSEPAGPEELMMGLTDKPDAEFVKDIFYQDVENFGPTLSNAIKQAQSEFSQNANAKVIIILTDGYMEETSADKQALIDAQNAGIKIVTVAVSTDEWDMSTFGTEAEPTAGNLYNVRELNISQYVSEVALEDTLLEFEKVLPNLTDAKDVEDIYFMPAGSKVGEIFSRQRNIDYSAVMTNENAEILDLDNIRAIQKQIDEANKSGNSKLVETLTVERNARIKELANNTKVTAITPNRNIVLSHKAERTQEVNLGLVERPKLEVKLQEKVSRIVVTLSNGDVIIDTAKDLTQNVQLIPNNLYSIYMDQEIMQGAKIDIEYMITITNNSQVDTLADYFTYDMFDPEEVAYMTRTVPVRIGTLNNYYSNLTFRAEDNTNLEVETNDVALSGVKVNGRVISDYGSLINNGKTKTVNIAKIETDRTNDDRAVVLKETVTWNNKQMVGLNESVEDAIDTDKVKVVETTSLDRTELFPSMSKEVLGNKKETSINLYVKYSKNISANDSEETLTYKNSTEIVERLSDVGRRDYVAVPGNYLPHDTAVPEYDGFVAERVIILPPFGEDHSSNYYVIALVSTVILGVGIVFIRRKVL